MDWQSVPPIRVQFRQAVELARESLVGEAPNIVPRATTCAFPFSNTGWKGNLMC